MVTRKSKVNYDEVFLVNTEDLKDESHDGYLSLEPKGSLYRIVRDIFTKDKDFRCWDHCMWESSILNIEDNK